MNAVRFSSICIAAVFVFTALLGWLHTGMATSASPEPVRSARASLVRGSQSAAASETTNRQVAEHLAAAEERFRQAEFAQALMECDRALAMDPRNGQARWLREQISMMQDTLKEREY